MVSELEAKLRSAEKRLKHRVSTQPSMSDVESVDFVINMISDALRDVFLKPSSDARIALSEIDLTLNVVAVHDEGGHLKFSAFGLDGDLGASHRTDDTHAIKISCQPQDLTGGATTSGETGTQPANALGPGNELFEAFRELEAVVDAERRQALPRTATITLNFVMHEDFSVSLVAAGQADTSTTHSICLRFDRPSTNSD